MEYGREAQWDIGRVGRYVPNSRNFCTFVSIFRRFVYVVKIVLTSYVVKYKTKRPVHV